MKWIVRPIVLSLLLVFFSSFLAMAQGNGDGREADHAVLRALMANAVKAINNQDMDALAACFTKKFAFTTVDQSVLTDAASLKKYYDRMLRSADSPVTGYKMAPTVDIPTIFFDANTGYSCGTSDDTYTLRQNGRVVHMTCNWTAAVAKEDGTWKLAAVHSGVNVMNNPVIDTVAATLKRNLFLAAGLGVLVGLVIGMLVGGRMRKAPVKI